MPPATNEAPGSTTPPGSNGAAGGGLAASNGAAGAGRALPHRTRQASLSPHLRDSLATGRPAGSAADPSDGRTPEQARDLAASLQTGWRRGRQDDDLPEPPDSGGPLPRRTGSPAPDSEEA